MNIKELKLEQIIGLDKAIVYYYTDKNENVYHLVNNIHELQHIPDGIGTFDKIGLIKSDGTVQIFNYALDYMPSGVIVKYNGEVYTAEHLDELPINLLCFEENFHIFYCYENKYVIAESVDVWQEHDKEEFKDFIYYGFFLFGEKVGIFI